MKIRNGTDLLTPYSYLFSNLNELKINFDQGWDELVLEMCHTLDLFINLFPEKDYSEFKITSIKQKFGGLEIETINSEADLNTILRATSILSYKTCEKCGKMGNLYCSSKWLHWSDKKVLCKNHAVELYYYSIKSD
jgi:isocitrate/isopropylmalate dehydrogenase